jgi:4-amino-4-deoxy-L-arabinose transferase-like glycosyltransferase/Flp pilus assembly protein TadD
MTGSRPDSDSPLPWRDCLIIFVLAVVIRLVFLFEFSQTLLFVHPVVDMAYHHEWAQHIANGESYYVGPFYRAPFYPLLLGLVYWVFGDGPWAIRVIQLFLGALSAVLIYLVAFEVFGRITARIAGGIAVLYGTLIFYDAQLLDPPVFIFLVMTGLWALLRLFRDESASVWPVLCGLSLGLAAITRPNILVFLALVLIWLTMRWVHYRSAERRRAVVLWVLAIALPILPITTYNTIQAGEPVLIGAYGGINLYIGNHAEADGVSPRLPNTRRDWWGGKEDTQSLAEADVGRDLSEAELSSYWRNRALREIAESPGRFLRLLGQKAILLMGGYELSNNFDLYHFAHQNQIMRLLVLKGPLYLPWGLILPLALAGMVWVRKWDHRRAVLVAFLLAYLPSILLFLVAARYRLPLAPVLIIFAAQAVVSLVRRGRELQRRRFLSGLAVLVVALVVVHSDPFGYAQTSTARGYHAEASILSSMGRYEQARELYRQALREETTLAESLNDLAMLLARQGDLAGAIELQQRAVAAHPEDYLLKYNLAYFYISGRRFADAVPLLEQVLNDYPAHQNALNNLGYVHLQMNQPDQAAVVFERLAQLAPQSTQAWFNLGLSSLGMGNDGRAIEAFERVIQLDPALTKALYYLGLAHLARDESRLARGYLGGFINSGTADSAAVLHARHLMDSLSGARP